MADFTIGGDSPSLVMARAAGACVVYAMIVYYVMLCIFVRTVGKRGPAGVRAFYEERLRGRGLAWLGHFLLAAAVLTPFTYFVRLSTEEVLHGALAAVLMAAMLPVAILFILALRIGFPLVAVWTIYYVLKALRIPLLLVAVVVLYAGIVVALRRAFGLELPDPVRLLPATWQQQLPWWAR